MVDTVEKPSPDWIEARRRFEEGPSSFRQLGEYLGVTHAAVRKRSLKENWRKFDDKDPFCKPVRQPAADVPSAGVQAEQPGASTADLTKRGRNLILALMAELEFLNSNHQTLVDMVETYLNEQGDARERARLIKALDFDTRAKTASNLATALAKLQDAAPGKKEEAAEAAKTAGRNSEWDDDLAFNGARPN